MHQIETNTKNLDRNNDVYDEVLADEDNGNKGGRP